uniref:DNA helicase n=1 Tax=Rhabditophanes sp. KR3021 TaxID=114890 RepID=A0AC35TG76_9BILA
MHDYLDMFKVEFTLAFVENFDKVETDIETALQSADNEECLEEWEKPDKIWMPKALSLLQNTFKLERFRPLQISAISSIMANEDCIFIMSTGAGKSLIYQMCALLKDGVTIVVSPLISLIEDQLRSLRKCGIYAATLNQSTSQEETKEIMAELSKKTDIKLKLLYVTPEKLAKSKRVMNKLDVCAKAGNLALVAIDEVHCISSMGNDFRSDYKFLNILKRQFGAPILGVSATLTSNVLRDVKEVLGIPAALVFKGNFNRENLVYQVKIKPPSIDEFIDEVVTLINGQFKSQSGIIYCFSRKECEEVASKLCKKGIKSLPYHANLEGAERSRCHESWSQGKTQVITATIAFGMGVDKPNIRFVIHHTISKSIENYYQESGRAGRDGLSAHCILYFKLTDVFRLSTMVCTERTGIEHLYGMIQYTISNDCRRNMASHFNESWDNSWCHQNCCDNYDKTINPNHTQKNVYQFYEKAVEFIDKEKSKDGRITGNKLLELICKSHKTEDKLFIEKVVAYLFVEGYLQEDFHFTAYSVISYVKVGTAASFKGKDRCVVKYFPKSVQNGQSSRKRKMVE